MLWLAIYAIPALTFFSLLIQKIELLNDIAESILGCVLRRGVK